MKRIRSIFFFPPLPQAGEGPGVRGREQSAALHVAPSRPALEPELFLQECDKPAGVHRGRSVDANDAPTERLNRRLTLLIAQSSLRQPMNAAVDFDYDSPAHDREINDVASDRMLPAHGDPARAQGSQRAPRSGLRRIGLPPQLSGEAGVLSVAHGLTISHSPLSIKNTPPHPRPLSRKRERGEGSLPQ